MVTGLAAALAGGLVASTLGVPLAWMIGAMLASGALAVSGRPVAVPPLVRPASLLVLGIGLGATFTPSVLAALPSALPAILAAAVGTILAGALVARLTARLARVDATTAYYASVPGGIVVMTVLAARAGVSAPLVSIAQSLRMAIVVLLYPPLLAWSAPTPDVGAFAAPGVAFVPLGLALLLLGGIGVALLLRLVDFANPWMMGGILVSLGSALGGQALSGVPSALVDAAQLGLGLSVGARMTRDVLGPARRLAAATLATVLLLSGLLAALGAAIAVASGLPLASCILGTAPGGMPEMAVTAKVLGLGPPLVLAFHLTRVLACNLLVAPIGRLLLPARPPPGTTG